MPALVDTLTSYVPTLVLRRLAADARPITAPQEERFPAAVLFADITGFTALTERLAQHGPAGAEEVSAVLNAHFEQLVTLVTDHGGDVIKFAGDALLALWEAPALEEDLGAVTLRAAACGLAVQAALHDYE